MEYAHAVFIALKRLKTALTGTLYSTTKPSDRSTWIFQSIPTRKARRGPPSESWPIPTGYSKHKRGRLEASPYLLLGGGRIQPTASQIPTGRILTELRTCISAG